MSDDRAITPVEVRAPRGSRRMEIDWADGHVGKYPHVILRGYCPCAHCQGHQGPIRFRETEEGPALEISEIEEVGNYALQISWGDGHGTGIYSFRYFRVLCSCESCGDPAERVGGWGRG
jgi:DUF971 family protein